MDKLRVEIVEDETITAAEIQKTLENVGRYITVIARNYKEVIKAFKRQPSDLA